MSIKNVVNKRLFFKNGSDEINNEIEDEIFKFNSSEKILCIGDVQSGKTGVMIRTIKKSLAHGYKMTIILAAHTKILVNQTKERVEQEFENDRNVSIYEIDETSYIHTSLRYVNQHLVFVLLKSSSIDKTLGELYDLIEQHKTWEEGIIIMDDECDSYSMLSDGTDDRNADSESLSIAMKINNFYKKLHGKNGKVKYLSITATPFDNIRFNYENKYDRSILLPNWKNPEYTGNEYFLKSNCYIVPKNFSYNDHTTWKGTIDFGIECWLTATFKLLNNPSNIKLIEDLKNKEHKFAQSIIQKLTQSEFVININVKMAVHEQCCQVVIDSLSDFDNVTQILLNRYSDIDKNSFLSFIEDLKNNLYIYTVNKNEKTWKYNKISKNFTPINKPYISGEEKFQIIIGGNKISRGLTINNLITEIMLSAPNSKTCCDTLLQKARWFGYRRETAKYIRIITNDNIKEKLTKSQECLDYIHKHGNDINALTKHIDYIEGGKV